MSAGLIEAAKFALAALEQDHRVPPAERTRKDYRGKMCRLWRFETVRESRGLWALCERNMGANMGQSEQINELATALSMAQSEITGAVKDAENPFFKSSYADLLSVWDAARVPLTKHGLCVVQTTDVATPSGDIDLVTTLAHKSGQWISGRLPIMPVKKDPQGIGSAITYARRYALSAIVGIAQMDDDGEAASKRPPGVSKTKQTVTPGPTAPKGGEPARATSGYLMKCDQCGADMMHSKYVVNELYCPKCKHKKSVTV